MIGAISHGQPHPLGATWDGHGVNFALFSEHAERVDLCLFDAASGATDVARLPLTEHEHGVWHGYVPGLGPGQLYGYRVHGPFDPQRGLRFNAHKLLLDPYARAVAGSDRVTPALLGFPNHGGPNRDLLLDTTDSAPAAPKGVVLDPAFEWGDDRPPRTPWRRTIIYEAHVRGLTMLHWALPADRRGTYAGLADPRVIAYLLDLGITAVELLPVHQFLHDQRLVELGLANYWGYNTIGFFAPHAAYSASGARGQQVTEFKAMVKALHAAGLEVILDVVYNHTAEANRFGPTVAFRGLDNSAYYRLDPGQPRRYADFTGTGNTLNTLHPRALQLVMDSLRYWVAEMRVDGFRFDLTPALARGPGDTPRVGTFFDVIHQDPVLAPVKLIAEPWDVGPGGYQLGGFPPRWAEWNDKYRDTVRRLWRGDAGQVRDLGYRLTGSSDLFAANGRGPVASLNFVAAHDGFTLRDLATYNLKHNEANGEANHDGHDSNFSDNHGAEGPAGDPRIAARRAQTLRNFLATLAVSQGVPMLLHGDEIGRTQRGNNNGYCQDGALTWQTWRPDAEAERLLAWTRRVLALRRAHPVLRRRSYFHYRPLGGEIPPEILWLAADGTELSGEAWGNPATRTLGIWLNGDGADVLGDDGRPARDDTLLILLNAGDAPVDFVLPPFDQGFWHFVLDTAQPDEPSGMIWGGLHYPLAARALAILRHPTPAADTAVPQHPDREGATPAKIPPRAEQALGLTSARGASGLASNVR